MSYPVREKVFFQILASTTALAFISWSFHWRCRGKNYYGDHKLFERVYNEAHELIDSIAEKAVGTTGNDQIVEAAAQLHMAAKIANQFVDPMLKDKKYPSALLLYVKVHIQLIEAAVADLREAGELTDGIEDLLQGLANKHEEHVYLLQRRVADDDCECPSCQEGAPCPCGEGDVAVEVCGCGCDPRDCPCPPDCDCGCNAHEPVEAEPSDSARFAPVAMESIPKEGSSYLTYDMLDEMMAGVQDG